MKRKFLLISAILAICLPVSLAVTAKEEPSPIYRCISTTEKVIALTFDDGPHPRLTAEILDLLAAYDAKATFFVVGKNLEYYGDLTARAAREGHEIGNHTYTHPKVSGLCDAELVDEIVRTDALIKKKTGVRCRLLRPPGGAEAKKLSRIASEYDLSVILWSIDTRDWAGVSTAEIVKTVVQEATPGAVILFHDYGGREVYTLDALKEILPRLSAAGFRFVTVSELLSYSTSASGIVAYSSESSSSGKSSPSSS